MESFFLFQKLHGRAMSTLISFHFPYFGLCWMCTVLINLGCFGQDLVMYSSILSGCASRKVVWFQPLPTIVLAETLAWHCHIALCQSHQGCGSLVTLGFLS